MRRIPPVNRWRRAWRAACVVGACGLSVPAGAAALSSYLIGNSLAADVRARGALVNLAAAAGHTLDSHEHIRGGRSLRDIVAEPDEYSWALNAGPWDQALPGQAFDALMLEPFSMGGFEATGNEEVVAFDALANTARATSSGVRVMVYEAYPTRTAAFNYDANWGAAVTVTGDEDFQFNRATFDWFAGQVQGPVERIPVGEAMWLFDQRARAGEIPAFSTGADLYRDQRHLNNVGRYLASLTFFSVMYDESPLGVYANGFAAAPGTWPTDQTLTPELQEQVQWVVWDTVLRENKRVIPEPGSWLVLGVLGVGLLRHRDTWRLRLATQRG